MLFEIIKTQEERRKLRDINFCLVEKMNEREETRFIGLNNVIKVDREDWDT